MTSKAALTPELLVKAAARFAELESKHNEPSLYGVTDGKAVGTYLEHKFVEHLNTSFKFEEGNSASGIDLPSVNVDIKVTSIRQPQSSCPYRSARQKIYGLGYSLLVFVYDKADDAKSKTSKLDIQHAVYIDSSRTADFQMTKGLLEILDREGNGDDLVAFMQDKNLPVDDIEARAIASELLASRPMLGYLTISNALQWRLQYGRVIEKAGAVGGIVRVR
jgi:hypothetical protein